MKKIIVFTVILSVVLSAPLFTSAQSKRVSVVIPIVKASRFKNPAKREIKGLVEAIKKYTRIRATVGPLIALSSQKLLAYKFIYLITDGEPEFTSPEIDNLKKFVELGGLIVADSALPQRERNAPYQGFKNMFKKVLGKSGTPKRIPKKSPLYMAPNEFMDGPPQGYTGGSTRVGSQAPSGGMPAEGEGGLPDRNIEAPPMQYLEGFYKGKKLVGILCNKGYGLMWEMNEGNVPELKIGVNMVSYAIFN